MNALVRGAAVLIATAAVATAAPATAQTARAAAAQARPAASKDTRMPGTEREKNSYAVGMNYGRGIQPVAPDIDFAALERAVRNTLDGGKPLIDETEARTIDQAVRARMAARSGTPTGKAPGAMPPAVDRAKVGLMLGSFVIGPQLLPFKDELDIATVMQGLRAATGEGTPALTDEQVRATLEAFGAQMKVKLQAKAAAAAQTNLAEGAAFLAKNKQVKGVVATTSGLQYMVLREGSGPRPLPTDKVRVNYEGKLLDGTVFDSTSGGQPAEFRLDQVIAGWTEGVGLMPKGAKYRFWIPGALAYGPNGTPGGPIGPNATLTFDVELVDILH